MSGQRVGYTSPYLPPELIWACGLVPVRLRPGNSLAAALAGDLDLAAVVFLDEDDTSRRLYDVWRAYAAVRALDVVPLPRLAGAAAAARYAAALAGLAAALAALSGRDLTPDALRAAIRLYNEQRSLWRRLRAAWIAGTLPAEDWYDLRWLALTEDPLAANAALAAALEQRRPPAPSAAGRRLLVLGAAEVPRSLLAFVEGCGARVVAEDSDADERVLTEPIEAEGQPPLEALAAAYLAKPSGPRPAGLPGRSAALARVLDERAIDGVIAVYPKFADAYLAEYLALSELWRARGLPALLVEHDRESGFSGQQRTRLEAFLEILA